MESKYEVFRQQEAKMNRALDRLDASRMNEYHDRLQRDDWPSYGCEQCVYGCCRRHLPHTVCMHCGDDNR